MGGEAQGKLLWYFVFAYSNWGQGLLGLSVWRFYCLGFYLNISISEWDQPHIKACCTLDLIWQWLSVMCLLSAGFCGHKFSVNTYDRVPLGLESSGLETAGFCSHWWQFEEKEIMWCIILCSELTLCLLAVTVSCVVTNFMECLSYLSGTIREKMHISSAYSLLTVMLQL